MERMNWIRTLPCACALGLPTAAELWQGPPPDRCRGVVEAHHAGVHGTGNKAPDNTTIPMCGYHHRSITGEPGGRGCFDGWPRGAVKRWELAAVVHYQRAYEEHLVVQKMEIW